MKLTIPIAFAAMMQFVVGSDTSVMFPSGKIHVATPSNTHFQKCAIPDVHGILYAMSCEKPEHEFILLPNGWLFNKEEGKCVLLDGKMWPKLRDCKDTEFQQWTHEAWTDGVFRLRTAKGLCLGLDSVIGENNRFMGYDCNDLSTGTWLSGLGFVDEQSHIVLFNS